MKSGKPPVPDVPNSTAVLLGVVTLVLAGIYGYAAHRFLPRSQTTFCVLLAAAFVLGSGTLFATVRDRRWWREPWRFWTFQFNFLTMFLAMVTMVGFHSFWPR
jgi:xanthine/uracil permease